MHGASKVFSRISELLDYLKIGDFEGLDANPGFPLRVPLEYAAKMEKGNLEDPLLLQVLPTAQENERVSGFVDDPVGDANAGLGSGILHKYEGRILLVASSACSVRCRFCFRRNEPCEVHGALPAELDAYLSRAPEIREVILSGGDPLVASQKFLRALLETAAKFQHVKSFRIHSRLPVTEPSEAMKLLPLLAEFKTRFRLVLVTHANHARELGGRTPAFLQAARREGLTLLNQSVLLRRVNDSAKTLAELSEALFDCGVLPYYLHLLDRANGTAHFEVPEASAREIYAELLTLLPGYLVPKLVREIAGEPSKTPMYRDERML